MLFEWDYGVQFEYTTPYTPEQNGVFEQLNRVLITIARAMLLDARLPLTFWGDAVTIASYFRNRTPIGLGGITPEEAYSGKKPYVGHLYTYGCLAYVYMVKEQWDHKLEPIAICAYLIGYIPTSRQYQLYDPVWEQIVISMAPIFVEGKRLD